jgi:hypothetical protein
VVSRKGACYVFSEVSARVLTFKTEQGYFAFFQHALSSSPPTTANTNNKQTNKGIPRTQAISATRRRYDH